jgi:hypothetical protein
MVRTAAIRDYAPRSYLLIHVKHSKVQNEEVVDSGRAAENEWKDSDFGTSIHEAGR